MREIPNIKTDANASVSWHKMHLFIRYIQQHDLSECQSACSSEYLVLLSRFV